MKKRAWWRVFGLTVIFLFFAGAFAGCASIEDFGQVQKDVAELKAAVGQKAEKAEVTVIAKQQIETVKLLGDTAKAVGELRKEAATKTEVAAAQKVAGEQVAALRADLSRTDQTVGRLGASIDGQLRSLEKRVVGMKQVAARVGALEDQVGIDHKVRLLRLTGFPTAKIGDTSVDDILGKDEAEFKACAEISAAMKKHLDAVAELAKQGWEVKQVVGFADERPFRGKDGKVMEKSDELNSKCAEWRAFKVTQALGVNVDLTVGRGTTTKFGNLDMNRSVLIYLERSQP